MRIRSGLVCPLCKSWYTDDRKQYVWWEEGEVCGNQAMTGPHPGLCSPRHPCAGRLVPCYIDADGDD